MSMASEAVVSDSVDPLSGLNGPSLFPRTIRTSADVPVPGDYKDLDSIHNFMKSLELKSPEKLMNEAKRIVDGGAEFLESNLASFAENMGISNAIAAKGKDRPQERRQGLGLARKRAPFSLKTSVSQPSVSLETTLNIDQLQDPDDFFDAYERMENAKKEIQKQMGGSMDNLNSYKPPNNARRRRQGILGKSYNYKHRYSSAPSENDDMLMLSQETVDQDIRSPPKEESQKKLIHPDPNPDTDIEDEELAVSCELDVTVPDKKTENEVSGVLEELLSCNNEDLEGDGALNILQEWLNIKPLDMENLGMSGLTDVRKTSASTVVASVQKPRKSSLVIDSVMKNLNRKPPAEHDVVANPRNPVSSPTPPRSPFASISLLKKKILQPNPLRDPYSPPNVDLPGCQNASPGQAKDKLLQHVDSQKDLGMPAELESHIEVDNIEPTVSNMHAQEVMGNADTLPEQFVDENASVRSRINPVSSPTPPRNPFASISSSKKNILQPSPGRDPSAPKNVDLSACQNTSPGQPKDQLLQQVDAPKDLPVSSELESCVEDNTEPTVSNMDVQEVMVYADGPREQCVDENASVRITNTDSRPHEEADNNVEKTMNVNEKESSPSLLKDKASDDATNRQQDHPEKQSEEHQANLQRGKRVAGEKRIRKAHPMRKSLAESGTSFEAGVRRSKRIKMRPLEYWKGERFLYGRVDNSLKLIGVKYVSPGKGSDNLKVKPYILPDSSEYKELLDLAARY